MLTHKKTADLLSSHAEFSLKPYFLEDRFFSFETNQSFLCRHFHLQTTDSLGFHFYPQALVASGALLRYLAFELLQPVDHIKDIRILDMKDYLFLDRATQRHLSILEALPGEEETATLLGHLNRTKTPMGMRMMRQWLAKPLLDPNKIRSRQDVIRELVSNHSMRCMLGPLLESIRDLDRLSVRLEKFKKTTHDLTGLYFSCQSLPALYRACANVSSLHTHLYTLTPPIDGLMDLLSEALLDSPAVKVGEGPIFKEGWNRELDQLREELKITRESLQNYQEHLRESLSIKTLKIGFTPAFGYFIEVSKNASSKVPPSFYRKQTLSQCERFYSKELQQIEACLFKLERQIDGIETELLLQLQKKIQTWLPDLKKHAKAIALIDCFLSLAQVAISGNYICPFVDMSCALEIEDGRHPLLERILPMGEFISNSTCLDPNRRLMLLTGPNMGGKSTYMRQVALLVVMAQMGSFVPAKKMLLGCVDRVFGRIGAHDALLRGQSTFMVEMVELANILRYATRSSLLILDEIGRGTSTYDGIALSQATLEMLLEKANLTPRTIVSTHYWELTSLAEQYHHAFNAHVSVEREGNEIRLLYRVNEGPGERSFGIHVARLAGLPNSLIQRAKQILEDLENRPTSQCGAK
ncbi:DNA mismatch repair protein MutS [Candidatus Similichlamydia laticola]|uniref:DNA mismatch repair protein MutS n=1 Tax=Candidatus Similichlamydia laticola TaxID=2170265 RepID=A0A369KA49_9BACT|nr:DNA mismatch repair protein MutS [Candidatus Similichlamydia laticola]